MKTESIAKVTLWMGRMVLVAVIALVFALPILLHRYPMLLGYTLPREAILGLWVSYILSAVFIVVALWNMEKLLKNILAHRVFLRENVALVRMVQHCCGFVALICLVAACFSLQIVLMAAVMGFLCFVVSVVACVLDGAVALQEENDLTI